jgi:hypothetical protein
MRDQSLCLLSETKTDVGNVEDDELALEEDVAETDVSNGVSSAAEVKEDAYPKMEKPIPVSA